MSIGTVLQISKAAQSETVVPLAYYRNNAAPQYEPVRSSVRWSLFVRTRFLTLYWCPGPTNSLEVSCRLGKEYCPTSQMPQTRAHEEHFSIRWSDLDANRHVKNTIFSELATHTRFRMLESHGFGQNKFEALRFGPLELLQVLPRTADFQVLKSLLRKGGTV